ncbi:hypothetical protein N7537_004794 [Penicillium hordei]|uniref:Uncharacterized protein n=1 Tax=Penicillium hordei TaxID=40994 RepID=A0AAD6H6F3_9EURO|nr:uncharacterized protein N7537_004794 [Penicillium hordei]KAJ5608175.1 hypothetical protein N7537_004794 [Penicillium hordei]
MASEKKAPSMRNMSTRFVRLWLFNRQAPSLQMVSTIVSTVGALNRRVQMALTGDSLWPALGVNTVLLQWRNNIHSCRVVFEENYRTIHI